MKGFGLGKKWLVGISFIVLVVVAVAWLSISEAPLKRSIAVTLPHSGETVTLNIVNRSIDTYTSSLKAELKNSNRTIFYKQSWSKFGDGYTLHYIDAAMEYEVKMRRPASSPPRSITYRCVRGDCNEFLNRVKFEDEYSKVNCPGVFFVILCFSNGTYLEISTAGEEKYLFNSSAVVLGRREYLFADGQGFVFDTNATISAFASALADYNRKSGESISLTLDEKDVQDLTKFGHGGWRICKFPFEIDSTHSENGKLLFRVSVFLQEKNETWGNGCPEP